MPVQSFNESERRRLSQFPALFSTEECSIYGTLTAGDRTAIDELRGDHNRLGYSLQLTAVRALGFVPDDLSDAPPHLLAYLARQLEVDPGVVGTYGQRRSQTRSDHFKAILAHLGWQMPTAAELATLGKWLIQRALEHDSPLVLFGLAADRLKTQRRVRPGVTILERLVSTTREAAQQETYRRLAPIITAALRPLLDDLLVVDAEVQMTRLTWLRQKAVANTPDEIVTTLTKIQFLQRLGAPCFR